MVRFCQYIECFGRDCIHQDKLYCGCDSYVPNVICSSSFVTFECFGGNYMFATLIICTAETCIACSSFFGVSGGNFLVVCKVCLAYQVFKIFISAKC